MTKPKDVGHNPLAIGDTVAYHVPSYGRHHELLIGTIKSFDKGLTIEPWESGRKVVTRDPRTVAKSYPPIIG